MYLFGVMLITDYKRDLYATTAAAPYRQNMHHEHSDRASKATVEIEGLHSNSEADQMSFLSCLKPIIFSSQRTSLEFFFFVEYFLFDVFSPKIITSDDSGACALGTQARPLSPLGG